MARRQQQQQQQQQQQMRSTVALVAMTMIVVVLIISGVDSFSTTTTTTVTTTTKTTRSMRSPMELRMGLFDNMFRTGGTGRDELDDEFEEQQKVLELRRAPKGSRDKYFQKVESRRQKADKERKDNWGWQTKQYKKGEDPIDEWKKRRADGTIGDLEDQYGDPKKIGGIPLPMASFGVGGEFGVGGKFDNGGRFDLRLPYADQGYIDEDADVMGKLSDFFGGNKKKKEAAVAKAAAEMAAEVEAAKKKKKKGSWPW